MNKQKKVLIIAYLFPPIGGGGVQRALKMAKYLSQFGWQPHILTVDPEYHVSLDDSLLDQLPDDVVIHRCREWSFGRQALLGATAQRTGQTSSQAKVVQGGDTSPGSEQNLAKSVHNGGVSQKSAQDPAKSGRNGRASLKSSLVRVLKRLKKWVLIPDDQILWFPSAAKEALHVVKEQGIDAVVSTSGPVTNHLVGLYVKRKTGLPWIADFRDPWTQNMHRTGIAWREWLEERLERMVHRESDCLLTVTHSFARNFMEKFHDEIRRVEVIHNGFDREDYEPLNKITKPPEMAGVCTFIYTGIFYNERNPRLLLRAVKALIDQGKIDPARIKLQFAGVFDYPGYTDNMDAVRELGLEPIVEIMGHLPHQQALAALKKADILMLIGDTAPGSGDYIPGKLFEYMAIGHPILALSLPGESTSIIERYGLGVVADPTDLASIQASVLRCYEQWAAGASGIQGQASVSEPTLDPDDSVVQYERKEQAKRLAQLLDEFYERRNSGIIDR